MYVAAAGLYEPAVYYLTTADVALPHCRFRKQARIHNIMLGEQMMTNAWANASAHAGDLEREVESAFFFFSSYVRCCSAIYCARGGGGVGVVWRKQAKARFTSSG